MKEGDTLPREQGGGIVEFTPRPDPAIRDASIQASLVLGLPRLAQSPEEIFAQLKEAGYHEVELPALSETDIDLALQQETAREELRSVRLEGREPISFEKKKAEKQSGKEK